ncbi:MAG: hypothetical protein L0287_17405, partial [Anaerolineae bacterium]|nr:hypothetical protein [Anaerolineae bacterium]
HLTKLWVARFLKPQFMPAFSIVILGGRVGRVPVSPVSRPPVLSLYFLVIVGLDTPSAVASGYPTNGLFI